MRSIFSKVSLSLILGVSVCGLTGYILYVTLRKKDSDDEDDYVGTLVSGSKQRTIRVPVPRDLVRMFIGRNGQNIRQMQKDTGTRITFADDDDVDSETRTCIVRGTMNQCMRAEHLVADFVKRQPVLLWEDVRVPRRAVGKIIGRCGETISEISMMSGAQLKVNEPDDTSASTRKIAIRGTVDQIRLAKSYIEEIVEQYQNTKAQMDATLAKREPRLPPKNVDGVKSPLNSPQVEKIANVTGQVSSPFEVYVSAMIDPSRFWVQIVGPKATELDLLVEEMTEYYKNSDNRELHALKSVQTGDLLAAVFRYDQKWYRAEVLTVNETDPPTAELYYVDYGDTDIVAWSELYELRTDFLQLHFQAIECFLARVEPVGDGWPEEAVDKFEEWTHVAQWQKLSAKINCYCNRERTRAKREGSPVPGVELYDVNSRGDVDIADELVKQGFAVYKKDSTRSSRAASVSNVSADSS